MNVELLTENHLKFLSLRGGCRGSSESTLVKMSNCWKSHAAAYLEILSHDLTTFQSFFNICNIAEEWILR